MLSDNCALSRQSWLADSRRRRLTRADNMSEVEQAVDDVEDDDTAVVNVDDDDRPLLPGERSKRRRRPTRR